MARQKERIEAHGLVELLTSYGGRAAPSPSWRRC